MLNLTKNQRADTMKSLSREMSSLSKVTGDGCSFEEGFAAGRIAVMMDMLTYREEVHTPVVTNRRIGNAANE